MVDDRFRMYSTEGKLVTEVPVTTKTEYASSRIVYHRMDLHNAHKKAAQKTSTITVASRVVECDPSSGIVHLEKGEKIVGDVIIGLDGM